MKFLFKRQWIFPFLLFLLLSGLLIFSWFRFGLVYGGGDVGLPTYDPNQTLNVTRYIWWESAAPGYPIPHGLTSAPLMFALSLLQQIGFSPLALQATFFFIPLFLMGFGMYLLAGSIFGKEEKIYAFLAAIFYLFNPYMLIQIWHRFIHPSIVFAALLPFFALFWRSWILTRKPKFLAFFLIASVLGTYIFGTIAFIVTLWMMLFLMTFLESIVPWKNSKILLQNGLFFIAGLVLWLLINSWWLIPTFNVGPALFSRQHSNTESVITLLEISRQEVLPNVLQMINPFYLYEHAELGEIYKNLFFKIMPWIFIAVLFFGLFRSFFDNKTIRFGLAYLIVLFLSKGAASPFGYAFLTGFNNLFIFGVLRNPFEKLGILMPLFASILFVAGLKSLNKTIYLILIPLIVVIFAWPLFSGTIFGSIEKPAFIKVPESYKQTDQWLKVQGKEGKILHLPLPLGEAVSYSWEYGYNGVEPSNLFFTSNPSISRGFNIETIDKALEQLSLAFRPQETENPARIIDLLQIFNVRFIIVHKDIKWAEQKLDDPNEVEKTLDKLSFLERKAAFGDLVVYEFAEKYYQPRLILATELSLILPIENSANIASSSATISLRADDMDEALKSRANETIIFPNTSFLFPTNSDSTLLEAVNKLTLSENSPLANLISAKNYFDYIGGNRSTKTIAEEIIIASQELIKIYQLVGVNQSSLLLPLVEKYSKSINEVFVNKKDEFSLYAYLQDPSEIFKSHLLLLKNIQAKMDIGQRQILAKPIGQISVFLKEKNLLPTYELLGSDKTNARLIFDFWIPQSGKYELYNKLDQATIQINDQQKPWRKGELLDLKEGFNEISINDNFDEIFLRRINKEVSSLGVGNITIEQKSPVYYQGTISLDRPGFLIFKESFHPGWKLEIIEGSEAKLVDKHYLANMYANGWFIEKGGGYKFKLEFEPQNKVTQGIYLAAAGWLAVLSLWLGVKLRKQ